MVRRGDIYGHINGGTAMRRMSKDIRHGVAKADSRPVLTELYRRAGYLVTLIYVPWSAEKPRREAATLPPAKRRLRDAQPASPLSQPEISQ